MKTRDTILLVDDDPGICQVLSALLEEEGFNVIYAGDGIECLRVAYEYHPDLVLLDILLPLKDGREVCKQLRTMSAVPIMMMSAIGADKEKVGRLDDGADDYITKPFSNDELVARIRALLRRTRHAAKANLRVYQDGYLFIDFDAHTITVNNKPESLSPKEWRLLEYLVEHEGRTVARQVLLRHVWGDKYSQSFSYLKVFVSRVRKKLGDSAKRPRYIYTQREGGYRFEKHA
jgi:DNA-binding response OmpR family regulator